jgi:hypothetical protein
MFDPKDIVHQRLTNSQDDAHRIGIRIMYELLKDQLHRLLPTAWLDFPDNPGYFYQGGLCGTYIRHPS